MDIQGSSVLARAKARLRALYRRPRGPGHPAGAKSRIAGDIDFAEAVDWDAIVNHDFVVDETSESPGAVVAETALSTESTSSERRQSTVFVLTGPDIPRPVGSVSAEAVPAPAATTDALEPGPAERPPAQAGERAPDSLLRTPTSVTTISDDFFDGLIRRVEGDR
jgi:hypothetical protein